MVMTCLKNTMNWLLTFQAHSLRIIQVEALTYFHQIHNTVTGCVNILTLAILLHLSLCFSYVIPKKWDYYHLFAHIENSVSIGYYYYILSTIGFGCED